jgi:hypothetical protein
MRTDMFALPVKGCPVSMDTANMIDAKRFIYRVSLLQPQKYYFFLTYARDKRKICIKHATTSPEGKVVVNTFRPKARGWD